MWLFGQISKEVETVRSLVTKVYGRRPDVMAEIVEYNILGDER